MELLFARGRVDVSRARAAASDYGIKFEADFSLVGAQSIENYVLPRESNGYEGYIRFPFTSEEDKPERPADELRIYFSPRGSQPYRIVFAQVNGEGEIGFDVSDQIWSARIAAQLKATGVVKREIDKPYRADPLDG
jgi:hypothetical protein